MDGSVEDSPPYEHGPPPLQVQVAGWPQVSVQPLALASQLVAQPCEHVAASIEPSSTANVQPPPVHDTLHIAPSSHTTSHGAMSHANVHASWPLAVSHAN